MPEDIKGICAIPVIVGGPIITAGGEKIPKEKGMAAEFGPLATMEKIIEPISALVGQVRLAPVTERIDNVPRLCGQKLMEGDENGKTSVEN